MIATPNRIEMATLASPLQILESDRLRSFVLPREHGAWGILLVPLLIGASMGFAKGRAVLPLILFVAASLSLFCLRTPLEAWVGTTPLRPQNSTERAIVLCAMLIYAGTAAFSVAWLLWPLRALGLLIVGLASAVFFAAQAVLKKLGRNTRMAAQLVGAMGLTSTAAGAFYVVTGMLNQTALLLWVANWLFAANQIHFVQIRIHGARLGSAGEKIREGRWFLAGELLTVCLLIAVWRFSYLPGLAAAAYVPVLIRGLRWFLQGRTPLAVHRLGLTELAQALVFGALFIAGFQL